MATVQSNLSELAKARLIDAGFDEDQISTEMLDAVVSSLSIEEKVEDQTAEDDVIVVDPVTGSVMTTDGVYIGELDCPSNTVKAHDHLVWMSEKRSESLGAIAGLEAEMNDRIERIRECWQKKINAHRQRVDGLEYMYKPTAESYAREMLKGKKAKSISVGEMILQFRKQAEGIEIKDQEGAVEVLENDENLNAAVKIAKSVLKSKLPKDQLATLALEYPSLFEYKPAGEKFSIK